MRSTPEYQWSAPLHFIDTPDWSCAYDANNDCPNQLCVAGAIANYTGRVTSTDPSVSDEAAKFITHFLGDIHQPLHVGFTTGTCRARDAEQQREKRESERKERESVRVWFQFVC